jgi:hypothetical protein
MSRPLWWRWAIPAVSFGISSTTIRPLQPDSCRLMAGARRLGMISAALVVGLEAGYAVTLAIGLASLPSPADPIGDPMFTVLELLILAIGPAIVTLLAAVHASAPPAQQAVTRMAVIFGALMAGITCSLHAVILAARRMPGHGGSSLDDLLAFRWPSPAYALDILAWDVFFALAVLFAAPAFPGGGLAGWIRRLLVTSGLLAFAGLSGVMTGNMQWRNIGIVGYVPVFSAAAVLLWAYFRRVAPGSNPT